MLTAYKSNERIFLLIIWATPLCFFYIARNAGNIVQFTDNIFHCFSYFQERKGKERKGKLNSQTDELQVFDKTDGTEIEDNEVLLSYDKGSVFFYGKKWLSRVKTKQKPIVSQMTR